MAIQLIKAGNTVTLTKENGSLQKITIGLKWGGIKPKQETTKKGLLARLFDAGSSRVEATIASARTIDVDSSVVVVDASGHKLDRIFYGKPTGKGIHYAGDDRTGSNQHGVEDNEETYVTLSKLDPRAVELYVLANIFSGSSHFGEIPGSYMRLINTDTGEELIRYELEDFKGMGGVVVGKLYKKDGEWKFKALGKGVKTRELSAIERTVLRG